MSALGAGNGKRLVVGDVFAVWITVAGIEGASGFTPPGSQLADSAFRAFYSQGYGTAVFALRIL
jgi:hypothetical protein